MTRGLGSCGLHVGCVVAMWAAYRLPMGDMGCMWLYWICDGCIWIAYGRYELHMRDMGCIWEIWAAYGRYGLHIGDMGCIWKIWVAYGRYGLRMGDIGCIWEIWVAYGCVGHVMDVNGLYELYQLVVTQLLFYPFGHLKLEKMGLENEVTESGRACVWGKNGKRNLWGHEWKNE